MKQDIRRATCLVAGVLLAGSAATAAVSFDFETPGQYSGNFSQIGGQLTAAQTSLGGANDYVRMTGVTTVTAQRVVLAYDTTPADGATTKSTFHLTPGGPGVTVSSDVQFTKDTASYGVYFINGADRTKAFLALFNVNSSGANDNIRFTQPTNAGWNPADNSATEAGLSLTAANAADAGITTNAFGHISVTYSIDASNHAVLSMTAGTRSTVINAPITAVNAFSDVEIAVRLSPVGDGQTVDIDNFAVVPEPASLGLLGLASLGLMRRRRA